MATRLQVAKDALENDSKHWNTVAEGLATICALVAGLRIPADEFPDKWGLASGYEELRNKQEYLAGQGKAGSGLVSKELRKVHKAFFDGADDLSRQRLEGLWEITGDSD